MKPPPFAYESPKSLEGVLDVLAEHQEEAKVLAGGQSLMPLLNMRLIRPAMIVDINQVPGLGDFEAIGDGVRIGATVRQRDLETDPRLRTHSPLIAEALPLIGHVAIRNRGTICGSLAHADPAAELPAVAVALDAEFVLARLQSQRNVPASEFFQTYLTTALKPDELLIEVRFPSWPSGRRGFVREFARRSGDFALVGVVVWLDVDQSICRAARVVTFATGAVPQRADFAAEPLVGQPLNEASIQRAVEALREGLDPEGDLHASGEYRRYVAGTLLARGLGGLIANSAGRTGD